jgi:hypothetical protein
MESVFLVFGLREALFLLTRASATPTVIKLDIQRRTVWSGKTPL